MEMITTGDPITAERAHHFGLVNELTEDGYSMVEEVDPQSGLPVDAPARVLFGGARLGQQQLA